MCVYVKNRMNKKQKVKPNFYLNTLVLESEICRQLPTATRRSKTSPLNDVYFVASSSVTTTGLDKFSSTLALAITTSFSGLSLE